MASGREALRLSTTSLNTTNAVENFSPQAGDLSPTGDRKERGKSLTSIKAKDIFSKVRRVFERSSSTPTPVGQPESSTSTSFNRITGWRERRSLTSDGSTKAIKEGRVEGLTPHLARSYSEPAPTGHEEPSGQITTLWQEEKIFLGTPFSEEREEEGSLVPAMDEDSTYNSLWKEIMGRDQQLDNIEAINVEGPVELKGFEEHDSGPQPDGQSASLEQVENSTN